MEGGLRRKDTTKGPPLRILSLDGGGVRGYSMLILLQELMHRAFVEIEGRAPKRHEIPKPCDHFDLIVGTGTGGLIGIMLGRLRMDIETCKDVYVRMTKRVFETDKTFAGIPLKGTLFKASRLEDAIRECVRDHTVYDDEGNDNLDTTMEASSPHPSIAPSMAGLHSASGVHRSMSTVSRYSQIGAPVTPYRGHSRWGNPNALLYDVRENRTKTAVTAVYKGTPLNGGSIFLRSYDSRKEPPPEKNCTIWQAGRATCATGLAFKPIQVGQSIFHDEGAGKYNPAPAALDEAICNEWPGREVGVFISIGTGKRPSGTNHRQHEWWEGFVGGGIGDFAEARRRLIAKIEGCEQTHQEMLRTHLSKRRVNVEHYYRLNVEIGVGEFGMNEWNRLSEISTNTRMYLAKYEVQIMNQSAAVKLAKIHFAKIRWDRAQNGLPEPSNGWDLNRPSQNGAQSDVPCPPSVPFAVELPAEDIHGPPPNLPPRPNSSYLQTSGYPPRMSASADDKFAVISSDEYPQPVGPLDVVENSPRHSGEAFHIRQSSHPHSLSNSPRRSGEEQRPNAPPIPPKTPIQNAVQPAGASLLPSPSPSHRRSPSGNRPLPYPEDDGPPPVVNRGRKPEFGVR